MPAIDPQRIAVTGACGAIGRIIGPYLRDRGHRVNGMDLRTDAPPGYDNYVSGSISDQALMDDFLADTDVVIHLAAYPNNADFEGTLLEPNFVGQYTVTEAAASNKVPYLIGTSSIQVSMGNPYRTELLTGQEPCIPTNHYAASKAYAEAMGQMAALTYGMRVLVVRVGWYPRERPEWERLVGNPDDAERYYLSHDDACRFYACAVESSELKPGEYGVLWANSCRRNMDIGLNLEIAKDLIHFEPQDFPPDGCRWDDDGGLSYAGFLKK